MHGDSTINRRRDDTNEPRWFVVHSKPGREALAVQNLANQGIAAFCPWMTTTRRVGNRTIPCKRALFPSYIFTSFSPLEYGWRSVNGTLGVVRLLSAGDKPLPLPVGFVERLIAQADFDDVIHFDDHLEKGAAIRIVGGPFDRLCGKLLTAAPSERVLVLIDTLFGETKVKIARTQLLAA